MSCKHPCAASPEAGVAASAGDGGRVMTHVRILLADLCWRTVSALTPFVEV